MNEIMNEIQSSAQNCNKKFECPDKYWTKSMIEDWIRKDELSDTSEISQTETDFTKYVHKDKKSCQSKIDKALPNSVSTNVKNDKSESANDLLKMFEMTQKKINSSINLNRKNNDCLNFPIPINSYNDCGSTDSAESPKRLIIDERLEVNNKQDFNDKCFGSSDFSESSKGLVNEERVEVKKKPNLNKNCSKYVLNFGSPDSSEKALVENLELNNNQNSTHACSNDVLKLGRFIIYT